MIGGGDQLYNDDVWNLPSLVQWLGIQDKATRLSYPFTQEMADQVWGVGVLEAGGSRDNLCYFADAHQALEPVTLL